MRIIYMIYFLYMILNKISCDLIMKKKNIYKLTLDRGSLGSWVDEDRSKLRVAM
jgi:hypothetical protein